MNLLGKILALLAVIIAVVSSFVIVPYSGLILVVLGLVLGFAIAKLKDLQTCVLAALGLALGSTVLTYFGDIWAFLGDFLTALFSNLVILVSAGALALALRYLVGYILKK